VYGTHQLLVYVDDFNMLCGREQTVKEKVETLSAASKEMD
jgi:hypothetical protein